MRLGCVPMDLTFERRLAVVPAYNEADTVGRVVRALHEHAPGWDVLVVDDGSTDQTGSRARPAGARGRRAPFTLGRGGPRRSRGGGSPPPSRGGAPRVPGAGPATTPRRSAAAPASTSSPSCSAG